MALTGWMDWNIGCSQKSSSSLVSRNNKSATREWTYRLRWRRWKTEAITINYEILILYFSSFFFLLSFTSSPLRIAVSFSHSIKCAFKNRNIVWSWSFYHRIRRRSEKSRRWVDNWDCAKIIQKKKDSEKSFSRMCTTRVQHEKRKCFDEMIILLMTKTIVWSVPKASPTAPPKATTRITSVKHAPVALSTHRRRVSSRRLEEVRTLERRKTGTGLNMGLCNYATSCLILVSESQQQLTQK